MQTSDFDYHLPPELIAQHACEPRDAARLLVSVDGQPFAHRQVRDLDGYLRAGDLLVLNRTRVIPARLLARKAQVGDEGGGEREVLLLHPERLRDPSVGATTWRVMIRGRVAVGTVLGLLDHAGQASGQQVTVTSLLVDGTRLVEFAPETDVIALAEGIGHVPLPPYIDRPDTPADRERYQTVFADRPGSVAAPTASLHLTAELLQRIERLGVTTARVELAIGPGTFKPVDVERVEEFQIHGECCDCPAETVAAIQATRAAGGRVIAAGTTVVRTLESAARQPGGFGPFSGWTSLFLHPPATFQVVDGLLTNFHLPRSSLLMLVACRTGLPRLHELYAEAVRERYRFFSYGDAMLLLPP
jgi:S-adenosylmethionine:tRNA ribosyltransferase-isomerase